MKKRRKQEIREASSFSPMMANFFERNKKILKKFDL